MKDMNKQIVNCLTKALRFCYPQYVSNTRHWNQLKTFQSKSSRYLCQTSNQRTITLKNNETNSDKKEKQISDKSKANIRVTFIRNDGKHLEGMAKEGDNLLDVIINNDIDLDGFGACEGTLACSTCHLIFSKEDFDRIADKPTDEEFDMLDLAYDLTDTSRLGCQVFLTKDMDGLVVRVPATVNDVRSN